MIKLIGIAVVALGFALRFNTLLVVMGAGIATGLVAGMSLNEIMELFGKFFVAIGTAVKAFEFGDGQCVHRCFLHRLPVGSTAERGIRFGIMVDHEIAVGSDYGIEFEHIHTMPECLLKSGPRIFGSKPTRTAVALQLDRLHYRFIGQRGAG